MSFQRSMFIAVVLLSLGQVAIAVPISFTHQGSGSGELDGISFSNSSFTINAFADTDNRQAIGSSTYWIDHDIASINITGVGLFDFITGTRTFVNQNNSLAGLSRAGASGADLFNAPMDGALSTWDMLTSIGPISGNGTLLQWDILGGIFTTGGLLSFETSTTDAQFEATVGTVSVPEPATMTLMGLGLLGLGWTRRKTNK